MLNNEQDVSVNIVGSSSFGISPKISNEKTYNMYISDNWLISFPGRKKTYDLLLENANVKEGRGIFTSTRGNIMVVVVNDNVYKIDSEGGYQFIGLLQTFTGFVSIDENLSSQICIVDGQKAYIFNYDLNSLTIQDMDSNLTPNYVCYHNTFFLFGNANFTPNGSKWYIYDTATPTTIQYKAELAIQTKSDYAIAIRRLPEQGNNIIVFGKTVAEIWTQVAGETPYRRNSTINIDYGTISVATLDSLDKYVGWLAINESSAPVIMIYSTEGKQEISTDGIDYLLSNLQYPEESSAFFFKNNGHIFYQLNFSNAADNVSIVYDLETKKFFHLSDYDLSYNPARQIAYFNNKLYFVSIKNGCVYELNQDLTTLDDNLSELGSEDYDDSQNHEIPMIRICSHIRSPKGEKFRIKVLGIIIQQGNDPDYSLAAIYDPATNTYATNPYVPRIDLALSYDGGETFGSYQKKEMRFMGQRKNITQWFGLGMGNEICPKFRFVGMKQFAVYNGYATIF